MPALRFFNILALASLAIVALSSGPVQVNALVADRAQVARHVPGHDALARRKRSDSSAATGRCKPRPSSTPAAPSTTPPSPATSSSPPTSTSSSAPPSTTTYASSSNGQKKMGLGWGSDNMYLENFANLPNVGYLYTWSPYIPSDCNKYPIQCIPMLWGPYQVADFQRLVVPGYAKYVLGMNEPNEPSQSNLSPQDGFSMWMQYINPLKDQGYTLISPACTNDAAGSDWYKTFMQLCQSTSGCHVDALAFHAYTDNAQDLINFANMLHDSYGLPVWITEFADQNFSGTGGQADMNQVWDFAGQVTGFVDNAPWLTAALPFGALTDLQGVNPLNSLMDGNGNPTALGHYYFG